MVTPVTPKPAKDIETASATGLSFSREVLLGFISDGDIQDSSNSIYLSDGKRLQFNTTKRWLLIVVSDYYDCTAVVQSLTT